ncbi:hypothetical protein Tco_1386283 [Tanacetum coccineum]
MGVADMGAGISGWHGAVLCGGWGADYVFFSALLGRIGLVGPRIQCRRVHARWGGNRGLVWVCSELYRDGEDGRSGIIGEVGPTGSIRRSGIFSGKSRGGERELLACAGGRSREGGAADESDITGEAVGVDVVQGEGVELDDGAARAQLRVLFYGRRSGKGGTHSPRSGLSQQEGHSEDVADRYLQGETDGGSFGDADCQNICETYAVRQATKVEGLLQHISWRIKIAVEVVRLQRRIHSYGRIDQYGS